MDMHSNVHEPIYSDLSFVMVGTVELHFVTSLRSDLDIHSRPQECEKAKTSTPVISQSSQSFWLLLRLVDLMNLIFLLFCVISHQWRESCSSDFIKRKV